MSHGTDRRRATSLVRSQADALAEIRRLSTPSAIRYIGHAVIDEGLAVGVELATDTFDKQDGGLPVQERERLILVVPPGYPHVAPEVLVDHDRWLDQPHVLQGRRLCLYLDPTAEWNPTAGMRGFFQRLWDWFADATANRFDPATAMYHPVGGVLHRTPGAPTLVVHQLLGDRPASFTIQRILLRHRRPHRIDVEGWQVPPHGPARDEFRGLLVHLSDTVPRGAGERLSDLCLTIRDQDSRSERKRFLAALAKVARTLSGDQHLVVVFAVPNQHATGEASSHLIAFRLPQPEVETAVRAATDRRADADPDPGEPAVEWVYVDDNRRSRTVRRDQSRPVNWFDGRRIELWGCGALGSWMAEHLIRAGASELTLRDPGHVTTGLLIRQNYTEHDVGRPKVDALADRLRAISDHGRIIPKLGLAQQGIDPVEPSTDLIVDCTVNTAVTVALDTYQANGKLTTPVLQAATDQDTASLGLVTVTDGTPEVTTSSLDRAMHERVAGDPMLTAYSGFWNTATPPPMVPAIGCSIPTFRGSAADVCSVAATAVTLAATALARGVPGGYLFTAAHAPFDIPPRVSWWAAAEGGVR